MIQSTVSFLCGLALGVGLTLGLAPVPWTQWTQWTKWSRDRKQRESSWPVSSSSSAAAAAAAARTVPPHAKQRPIVTRPRPAPTQSAREAAVDPTRLAMLAGLLASDALTYSHPHAASASHHHRTVLMHPSTATADTSVCASPNSSPRLAPLSLAGGSPIPPASSSSSTSRRVLRGHARSTSRDLASSSSSSSSSSSFILPTAQTLPLPPPKPADLTQVLVKPSPDSLYSDAHLALNLRPASGFMNVGLWTDPFTSTRSRSLPCDLTTAGQALVRLVAEYGNLRSKRVMDVGYGLGDSSLLLHAEFACDVVGITYSVQQAAIAHLRAHRLGLTANVPGVGGPGVHLYQGDAADLEHEWRAKMDAVPVDAIVSIDSAYHYKPRSAFFNQAFTVLSHAHMTARPPLSPPPPPPAEGTGSPATPARHRSRTPSASTSSSSTPARPTLVTLDLIVPATRLGRLLSRLAHIPLANLGNILDYERQVSRVGFVHVEMVDVSHAVFPGLTQYLTGANAGFKWRVAGWMWWVMWRWVGVQCVLVRAEVPPVGFGD